MLPIQLLLRFDTYWAASWFSAMLYWWAGLIWYRRWRSAAPLIGFQDDPVPPPIGDTLAP